MQRHYSTNQIVRTVLLIALGIVVLLAGFGIGLAARADYPLTCWVLCKPGAQVNVRQTPDNHGNIVGFLEAGDSFQTDARSANGYIHVLGIGEHGDAWISCHYVVESEPVRAFENYSVVAKNRVACRRWVNGPQIENRGWLVNGSEVQVFWLTDEWAVTSRGYIKSAYLEVAP